jgi:hypothetical protein
MIVVFSIFFILNSLFAIGLKSFVNGDRWIKPLAVRLFLLIPPVSITLVICIWLYAMVWTMFSFIGEYLSND